MDNAELLQQWYAAKQQLAHWKDQEMELRKQLAQNFFPEPKEGTNTFQFENGAKLKLVQGYDRKIDPEQLKAHWVHLQNAGLPMDELVKFTPELRVATYKDMSEAKRALMDQVITMKPSSPSLALEAPKEKK